MHHIVFAAVVLLLAPYPADAWQVRVGSNLHSASGGVAIDSRGDVIGASERRVGSKRFPEIVKLSAERGRQQWRRRFDDADPGYVQTLRTTVGDDVIAVVRRGAYGTGVSTIMRLAAADGAILWRYDVPITTRSDRFSSIAVDPTGDLIVGAAIDGLIVVLALRGTDGAERWRWRATPVGQFEGTNAVAIAPDGDVVVAGDSTAPAAVLARLDGGTGVPRWTRTFPHLQNPHGLRVDGDGTVAFGASSAVGSYVFNPTSRFTVVLLDAAGELVWERRIEPADGNSTDDRVASTTFLPGGDVAATGSIDDETVTVRLARTTGDVVWRHDLDGENGFLVRKPDGDLLIGASVFHWRTCSDFVLLDLSATTGTERGQRRMRGRAANDRSGCSSGVNDDWLWDVAVSDLGVLAIAARVGDPRGPRRLIARFPLAR
jgi:outer membrane protein assembly factor BamB